MRGGVLYLYWYGGGTGRGICVLEAEDTVARHASARSAQQLIPSYGPEPVLELTRWSIAELARAAADLASPLVWPSPFVVAGSPEDVAAETVPGLRSVGGAQRAGGVWELTTAVGNPGTEPGGVVRASTVVNAAGAWAEHVGSLLGAAPQGLQPLRRTAALVRLAEPMPPEHPMVMDAARHWYYRPDPVGAMISVGESEPSEACDARPHSGAVERLVTTVEEHTELRITEVAKAWTGLRTERATDVPVCGWDVEAEGVFWLAGQGATASAPARPWPPLRPSSS